MTTPPAAAADYLDRVSVAAPCTASWEAMTGDDRVRFCDHCRLNVYNLSSLSREEAENLVRSKEGRLCVRFYRRADGTMLTDNCPVGLRAIRRRLAVLGGGLAACLTFLAGGVLYVMGEGGAGFRGGRGGTSSGGGTQTHTTVTPGGVQPLMGTPVPPPPRPTMGDAISPPQMGEAVAPDPQVEMGKVMVQPPAPPKLELPPQDPPAPK